MRQIWLIAATAMLLMSAFVWATPRSGEAQDSLEGRVAALETQVATQGDQIADLTSRVKKLEKDKSGSSSAGKSSASSSSLVPVKLSGSGPSVTDKFTLKAGRYKVTATVEVAGDFDGFILDIYPPKGSSDNVMNELIQQSGTWSGSAVYEAPSDGSYYVEVQNTSSPWTITFDPL